MTLLATIRTAIARSSIVVIRPDDGIPELIEQLQAFGDRMSKLAGMDDLHKFGPATANVLDIAASCTSKITEIVASLQRIEKREAAARLRQLPPQGES